MILRHQDDSWVEYVHFRQNAVALTEGSVVQRGEVIGAVGTTGGSSRPHLHFEFWDTGDINRASLFQADDPNDPGQKLTCYEPDHPEWLKSDNLPR